MSNKFWAQGSDSGSDASSDDDSEESVVQQRTGKFAMSDSSSGKMGSSQNGDACRVGANPTALVTARGPIPPL